MCKKTKNCEILDVCCGGKMFYFDKNDERVLFQDIREVDTELCDGRKFCVKPDIIGDFRSMVFPDESFSMVVFDPPHLLRNKKCSSEEIYNGNVDFNGWQHIKYGALGDDWRDVLRSGFSECFRVLKKGGFLVFKWNETDIRLSEILSLTEYKPVFGHKSGKRSNTHWLMFVK